MNSDTVTSSDTRAVTRIIVPLLKRKLNLSNILHVYFSLRLELATPRVSVNVQLIHETYLHDIIKY